MSVIFKPSSHKINIVGAISRLSTIVQNRPLGICLQGKSIQELEDRIEEFKEAYICWVAMNRFDIYQKYILDKIDKKLSIVMDVGEVEYAEDYEKQIRIPRWKDYLLNPDSLLITSVEILENIKLISGWNIIEEHQNQLIMIEECRKIRVPNSIMLYLMVLAKLKVNKIILFGFDGFGNPKAFKDTPVWSGKELEYEHEKESLEAYYKQESVLEERRVGYHSDSRSDLHSNCPTFNDQFWATYTLYCSENHLQVPEIINCSPKALYTVFRKVDYVLVKGELR